MGAAPYRSMAPQMTPQHMAPQMAPQHMAPQMAPQHMALHHGMAPQMAPQHMAPQMAPQHMALHHGMAPQMAPQHGMAPQMAPHHTMAPQLVPHHGMAAPQHGMVPQLAPHHGMAPHTGVPMAAPMHQGLQPQVVVAIPAAAATRRLIDQVAQCVSKCGFEFEALLMEREPANVAYNFLFDAETAEQTYYRWRVYSFAQGDTTAQWRTEPFQMVIGGTIWKPPPIPPPSEQDRSPAANPASSRRLKPEDIRRLKDQPLSDKAFDQLGDLLRAITLSRKTIAEVMAFALDNSDCASEVIGVIKDSLTLKDTSAATKIARLYLVSDVLHNSSAPVRNASSYRSGFEAELEAVFVSFRDCLAVHPSAGCSECNSVCLQAIEGKVAAASFRQQVMQVLEVWDRWSLYPSHFIQTLVAQFEGKKTPPKALAGKELEDIDGAPLLQEDIDGEDIDGEDIDGEDIDGELLSATTRDLIALPTSELVRACTQRGLIAAGSREAMILQLTAAGGLSGAGSEAESDDRKRRKVEHRKSKWTSLDD